MRRLQFSSSVFLPGVREEKGMTEDGKNEIFDRKLTGYELFRVVRSLVSRAVWVFTLLVVGMRMK